MEEFITLDYGSGGRKTSALIEELILPLFENDALAQLGDGAVLEGADRLVFSTDSFVVQPLFFPGGDIGELAVCGTVNDVSMAGGIPKYLSLSLIIEEGLPTETLRRVLESAARAAGKAGVRIVTGDTKVVGKGACDGLYLNTAGIGTLACPGLSPARIRPGDKVILSGTCGDHGTAVMLARQTDLAEGDLRSDCAPLHRLAQALFSLGDSLRVLRDPTRGGVATTLNEFTEERPFSIELEEEDIPVRPAVRTVCDMLGLDPLYCANEGKLLAVVAPEAAESALTLLQAFPEGREAAVIGTVSEAHPGRVLLRSGFGGSRILLKLSGAQLPRIC